MAGSWRRMDRPGSKEWSLRCWNVKEEMILIFSSSLHNILRDKCAHKIQNYFKKFWSPRALQTTKRRLFRLPVPFFLCRLLPAGKFIGKWNGSWKSVNIIVTYIAVKCRWGKGRTWWPYQTKWPLYFYSITRQASPLLQLVTSMATNEGTRNDYNGLKSTIFSIIL